MDKDIFIQNLHRKNFAMISCVTLKGLHIKKHCIPYIPKAKSYGKCIGSENGKIYWADEVTFWAADPDMRIILDVYHYEELIIHKYYYGQKKPLPYTLISTVLDYFKGKSEYKNVTGMETEYSLSKQLLNGVYGMAGTSLKHNKLLLDKLAVIDGESEYKPSNTLPYQWAVYITAYVREQLYSFITDLANKYNDAFIYADTDSIFYIKSPETEAYFDNYNRKNRERLENLSKLYLNAIPVSPDGSKQYLGAFELEDDDIKSFISVGAKRYAITHSNGLIDVTFAGLSATKVCAGKNGYNTQRLIDLHGSIEKAFIKIRDSSIHLDYVEGIDKLSNYNTIFPYEGTCCGHKVKRPCSYVLYGQSTTISLNEELLDLLTMEKVDNELF